jgi:predicted alpha/beta-hydrolase family hydrolase
MNVIAEALRAGSVVRFEFPYMARRREGGGVVRGPGAVLMVWHETIDELGGHERLVIGGRIDGRPMRTLADETGWWIGVPGLSVSSARESSKTGQASGHLRTPR